MSENSVIKIKTLSKTACTVCSTIKGTTAAELENPFPEQRILPGASSGPERYLPCSNITVSIHAPFVSEKLLFFCSYLSSYQQSLKGDSNTTANDRYIYWYRLLLMSPRSYSASRYDRMMIKRSIRWSRLRLSSAQKAMRFNLFRRGPFIHQPCNTISHKMQTLTSKMQYRSLTSLKKMVQLLNI